MRPAGSPAPAIIPGVTKPPRTLLVVLASAGLLALAGLAWWGLSGSSEGSPQRADAPFEVAASDLGIHANHTRPAAPTGALRLNCYPTWRETNPAPGVYDWTAMDALVDRARSWGYQDIVHSFCATPEWAAGPVDRPKKEVLGARSTAAPPLQAWKDYTTAVVQRYKGRITAYQAWNEGTTAQFFQGTPDQLADMTVALRDVVAAHDPDALVVSASVQQVTPEFRDWGLQYLTALKQRDWPIEVISFHSYAEKDSLTPGRQGVIEGFHDQLEQLAAPDLPLWDTETTYTGRPVTGEDAGALVVRSFLDSWRMGVDRTYWYIWFDGDNPFGSIQMRADSAAGKALKRFGDLVIGATYQGCTEEPDGLVRCPFERDGKPFTILWAEQSPVAVTLPEAQTVTNLATGKESTEDALEVGGSPVLVPASVG